MSGINQLKRYVEVDAEKLELLNELRLKINTVLCSRSLEMEMSDYDACEDINCDSIDDDIEKSRHRMMAMKTVELYENEFDKKSNIPHIRYCPKCARKFGEGENFCPDCLVILKDITDTADIKELSLNPNLEYVRNRTSDNILTEENIALINRFEFTFEDFNRVVHSIRAQAFKNMDNLIKDNDLDLDELDILDKIILFAKSFVNVEYKSYGELLGYFEFDRIYVDDRQRKSLQITTIIHELTHFLVKEILTRTVCEILDCTKNRHIEAVITYILTYSVFNNLIDEYAAHSVEGRFTIFGYQDYSSFTALQNDLDEENIDIAKTIGNTFSIHIKDLMEGFLDWDVREEIKEQFLADTIESPDYAQLRFESCKRLSDEGFMKAIWVILSGGFENADEEIIMSYENQFAEQ